MRNYQAARGKETTSEHVFSAPSYLTDREAEALIDTKIQTMFEELRLSIEQEAVLMRFG